MSDEFADLDAVALAELVKTKRASSLELCDAAIQRIERLNPGLNAVITPMFESARERAKQPTGDGPFAGVPYLLKDLMASCADVPLHSGSRMMQGFVPGHDSALVSRLRRAGFVFLGKTNVPEFGIVPTTEPLLFGATKNPWDRTRSSGGSSGGSAAAVAARMVPAAHASDGGGSIRVPASCCGLFGMKTTRGRISHGPDVGDVMGGLVVEHAVTRSVRDSAAILDATEGPSTGDPYFAARPLRPFAAEVGTPPGRLRIAFSRKNPSSIPLHPDVERALDSATKLVSELGHEVMERDLPLPGDLFLQSFSVLWTSGVTMTLDGLSMMTGRKATPETVEPLTWALSEAGRYRTASEYMIALAIVQRLAREVARFMKDVDVFLTPTLSEPPLVLGSFDAPADSPLEAMFRAGTYVPFTPIQNATGQPAMNVPLHWNDAGLPIGVQFVGRYGDEATLFRLAAQLEAARPWANRRPPDP
jgi:amidase